MGLSKPTGSRTVDQLAAVQAAWERYRCGVERLLKEGVTDENRDAVAMALRTNRDSIPDFG